ncbi:hypothetical protein [Acidilobus sp.]|uniref:hypothetical protein n=1 Tax=Acidilobus sp. TaxID=1872109 RepID=UPI003D092188
MAWRDSFRRWAEEELVHSRSFREIAKEVRSPLVKAIILAAPVDPQKRSELYRFALELLRGPTIDEGASSPQ